MEWLTVKTHVLGERKADCSFHLLFVDEVPYGESIIVKISSRQAKIRGIEQWEQVPLFHDIGNLLPLVLGGIASAGVVCTSMEDEYRTGGSLPKCVD